MGWLDEKIPSNPSHRAILQLPTSVFHGLSLSEWRWQLVCQNRRQGRRAGKHDLWGIQDLASVQSHGTLPEDRPKELRNISYSQFRFFLGGWETGIFGFPAFLCVFAADTLMVFCSYIFKTISKHKTMEGRDNCLPLNKKVNTMLLSVINSLFLGAKSYRFYWVPL